MFFIHKVVIPPCYEAAKQGDTGRARVMYEYASDALKIARDNNQPLPAEIASFLIERLDALETEKDANKALLLSGFGRPKDTITRSNVLYYIGLFICPKKWKQAEESAKSANTAVKQKHPDLSLEAFYSKYGNTPPDPENPLELKEVFKKVSEIKRQNGKTLSPRTIEDIYYQHHPKAKKSKPIKTDLQKEFLTKKLIP